MLPLPTTPLRAGLQSLKLQSRVHGVIATLSLVPTKRQCKTFKTPSSQSFTSSTLNSRLIRNRKTPPQPHSKPIRFASTSAATPATPSTPRPAETTRPTPPQPQPQEPSTTSIPDPSLSYAAPVTPSHPPLTWNAYLSLRHIRRRYNQIASLGTALTGGVIGSQILASQSLETMGLFGLDPLFGLGIGMAGFLVVGWLSGGSIGGALFAVTHRRQRGEIAEKERDFYRHLVKHRVDPSGSSAALSVPDYYGEKIGSVKDYRNWLKNQRTFNRSRQNPLGKWTKQ